MSFESDGQGPGDERLGEQLGRGSVDQVVHHKGVVDLDSGSETSQSEPDAEHSASDAGASHSSRASDSDASVSQESATESPPAPEDGGPEDLRSGDLENHLNYDNYTQAPSHAIYDGSTDLFGLAAHALAAHNSMETQGFQAAESRAPGPELREINVSEDTDESGASSQSSGAYAQYDADAQPEVEEPETKGPEIDEPEVDEPGSGIRIEEIDSRASSSSSSSSSSSPPNAAHAPAQPLAQPLPNLEEMREIVRAESRSRIRALEAEIQRLETAEWDLRRKLSDANLQVESARSERERMAVSAAVHTTELQRLRASTEQLRSQHEARVVELRTTADEQRVELEAQRRAHDVLRNRFAEQSGQLADSRAAVAELERTRVDLESQASNARRAEHRTQLQLAELREELDTTLSELANARAELTLQTQTLAEVRAQAREEALDELAPASSTNEESMWRERYIELRRQMDAVASEFERREPEVLALQREHADAEARAVQAQDETDRARSEKTALERQLRAADRRASDLLVEQQLTEQLIADLRRQVLHLLTEKMLSTSGDAPLSAEDEEELVRLRDQVSRESDMQNGDVDGQALISERLLLFKDVAELQFQNEALLKACRGLAQQLDPDGDAVTSAAAASNQRSSADELREAGDALEALERRFVTVQAELDEMRQSAAASQEALIQRETDLNAVRTQLKAAEGQVADLRRRLAMPEPTSNGPSQELALLRLELQTERTRYNDTQRQLDVTRDEVVALQKRTADGQAALTRAEQKIAVAESAASQARAEADQAQIALSALHQEKALWAEREQRLMLQVSTAQAEAAAHARSSGASQSRQAELESKLIGTMERLESLVASSAGDAHSAKLQEQADAAESRVATLQTQIDKLEGELNDSKSESSAVQNRLNSVITELEAARNQSAQLTAELSSVHDQHTAEKAHLQKRDDDLVEQVNNLEDSLTEVREKLRKTDETLQAERKSSTKAREELEATHHALEMARQNLDTTQKELESEKEARKVPQAAESEETRKQREESVRRELEAHVRSELEARLRTEIESSLRSEFEGTLRPDVESSIRSDIERTLKPELERSVRSEVEAALRLELEKSLRDELESTLRSELESSIRSELASVEDRSKEEGTNQDASVNQESREALRAKIEAEVRAQISAETKPEKQEPLPVQVQPLFEALSSHAPREEVEQFQEAVLAAEQERVRSAFRKRLDSVRENAEEDTKAKVAEAEKRAEEKAAKRAEMRTKLQTQKLTKLEAKNKELETQVDELRNKVRRLKGGANDSDSVSSPQQPAAQQQLPQTSPMQPFVPMSMQSPFASFPSSDFPISSAGFGLDQSQKRPSFFPDNDNQKKRKEEEGSYGQ